MNRIVRGRKDKRKLELIELAPEDIVPVGLAGAAIIGVQFVPVVTVWERLPVQRVKRAKKNDCCRDHPEPL